MYFKKIDRQLFEKIDFDVCSFLGLKKTYFIKIDLGLFEKFDWKPQNCHFLATFGKNMKKLAFSALHK